MTDIKVIYSGTYYKHGRPEYLLNGYHPAVKDFIGKKISQGYLDLDYLHNLIDQDNSDFGWRAFVSHGNFQRYFLKHRNSNDIVMPEDIVDNGSIYLYPVEICYAFDSILNQFSVRVEGTVHNYEFINLIPDNVLQGIRQGYVKLVLNTIHDPLENKQHIQDLEQYLIVRGVPTKNTVIIGGNRFDDYFRQYPSSEIKITNGYIVLNQVENKVHEYREVMGSLGYMSEIVTEQDLDKSRKRPKKFICLNRNMHRPHRWVLAYFAVKHNLLSNSTFSFLVRHGVDAFNIKNNIEYFMGPGDYTDIANKIDRLVPLEVDTQNTQNKNGFTLNNNRKDLYADTYINIVSETSFDRGDSSSPFISEKTFLHPMVNLQPFIIVGNPHTLKSLRDLGFKTFSPYIDETYDTVIDFRQRIRLIEQEIVRLNSLPQEQLHELYYSLADTVLYNQQLVMSFSNHDPFAAAFNDIRNWYESSR